MPQGGAERLTYRHTARPRTCSGTARLRTPDELRDHACRFFSQGRFTVAVNAPYTGTIIPTGYQGDARVGNFLRRLVLLRSVKHWSLTTLREKVVKIGAEVVTYARYVTFQMAEVAIPMRLFEAILHRIRHLGPLMPAPT